MAVYRIEKTRDYTVMSNHHLRNTALSLKAKGLLSLMLSLPENWDYTTKGLAKICKDGTDSICTTIKELEKHGYVIRERVRNDKGQLTTIEYTILEQPKTTLPTQEIPKRENPVLDNPKQDEPILESPAQLNTNLINKKELNIDLLNTYPIKSYQDSTTCNSSSAHHDKTDGIGYGEMLSYRELIKSNIEYEILSIDMESDNHMLDEIVDLLTETVCTSKEYITIAGDTFPSEVVKSKLLKLNSEHIRYVVDCMRENTTDVRNIKKYILAALFNAPSTIDNYYRAKVNHDFHGVGYG